MLSVLLFSFGTAQAVLGVADDVPGTDVVIPIICEEGGTLNTIWAIGEVLGLGAGADVFVFNRQSHFVLDSREIWTGFDVESNDCQSIVALMSPDQKTQMRVSISGKNYFVGYILYFNDIVTDQLVPWVYLTDLPKGFASGFNGFAAEGGVDLVAAAAPFIFHTDLLEAAAVPVTATALFPRFFLLNNNADTFNWWIILAGTNVAARTLNGAICNEEEDCISLTIPIPFELNVVVVANVLPAALFTGFPHGGMGIFAVDPAAVTYSIFGWAYERQQSNNVQASWDVIHPMHRFY
jgi:hypothetical protein